MRRGDGPVYLAIADAIAGAIGSGELPESTRLPPQRTLAKHLGIDFTTVSRAYAEAQRRGLVTGKVGQGTFVQRARPPAASAAATGLIDLSMTLPPPFEDAGLIKRMWRGISGLEETGGLDLLLRYQPAGGATADRVAGVRWLSKRMPGLTLERVLVSPGTQSAMLAVICLLAAPGETVLTEAITYPGFRSLAGHLHLRLRGLPMDREGLDPDALDAACRQDNPKALYCTPTQHNPTTATMSAARREAVVAVARRHGIPIVEDDSYGALPTNAPPPLAALAPELTYCLGGLAKTVSPALRIAYLVSPDTRAAARVVGAIRATATMASPLTAAIATRWIQDGTADAVLTAIREETRARQAIAARILPPEAMMTHPEAHHLWLNLAKPWTRGEFASRLSSAGVGIVTSDAFALTQPTEAVRIGLGAPATRSALAEALQIVADLLNEFPVPSSMVV
jgi:DNA-binding transcriptional MocR family regulator